MADSSVVITQGTGTDIDTRTESTNGNHRQVIVVGDPSSNSGVAPVDGTNGLAVDPKTLPPGAATSAKQDSQTALLTTIDTDTGNIATSVASIAAEDFATETTLAAIENNTDGIEGLLTTIDADTGNIATDTSAIKTSVQLIDDTVGTDGGAVVTKGVAVGGMSPGGSPQFNIVHVSTGGAMHVDGSAVTQPVSAASLPLPTGAATSANQTTANSSLSSIDGKLNSLGQKTMANSAPVVLASDQSAIPASQSGTWNITNVSGTVSLPTGAATSANQTNGSQQTQIVQGGNTATVNSNGSLTVAGVSAAGVAPVNPPVSVSGVDGGGLKKHLLTDTTGAVQGINNASSIAVGLSMDRRTALSNTAVAVKASSGRVYGYHFFNPNTSDVYVQFYDLAAGSVVVGTTTPVQTLWIPSGGAIDDLGITIPLSFSTAVSIACTTTITGGSAPSSGILANTYYI